MTKGAVLPRAPAAEHFARLGRRALTVGGVALGLSLVGLVLDPTQFLRSYLLGFLFWAGVSIGCLSITLLHHLTGGMWGLVIRRFLEAGTRTLPAVALAFLPIAIGVGRLYPWARPGALEADAVLAAKAPYLNVPFFLARAAICFLAWNLLAHFLNRWSLATDRDGDPRIAERLRRLAGGGLVVLGLTVTFSAFDWGMSLDPHWFSTIYGLLFMIGQVLSALAFSIVLVAAAATLPPMSQVAGPRTVHDLGKLLLAFTMLWAYLNLSQFLIIWSGNVSEETPFYLRRLGGGWQGVALLLLVFHFALPFVLLLSRDLKRDARRLGRLALVLFAVRLLDLFWLLGPDLAGSHRAGFHRAGHGEGPEGLALPLHLHWLDLALPVALGGLWLFHFTRKLLDRPLLPVGEPEIRALLAAGAEESAR